MIIWILISIKNINFSKMSMMTSYLNNQTIYLNSNPSTNQENEFFVWLVSAEDAMMYHIRDLPKHYQWICITLIWLMVSIIFCFRSLLYSHLYQKYRKKEFNAINVLTFVEAILWRQITVTALAVFYTVMVVSDAQPEEITGPWFCYPITLLYRFVIFYTPLGQLGIAIYRILLLNAMQKQVGNLKCLKKLIHHKFILILIALNILDDKNNLQCQYHSNSWVEMYLI